ncbi:MAG: DUF1343 domain-containing protein [Firmicutes bacterium]|nr:DUF1343 domain-containing protein [Bacillota bacterium]
MSLPAPVTKISTERLRAHVEGKRLALMMNHAALTNEGQSLIDVMHDEWKCDIKFLFGMEHGVRGELQPGVRFDNHVDAATGLPVISLYGFPGLRPPAELIAQVDAVVFCAQDAGIRHFTFTPWMTYLMDAAGQVGTEVIVVDRPNPLNGRIIEGGVTQEGYYSLIGAFSYPLRHGMTIGELALMYNGEHQVGCKLTVIPMENWARDMWYDQTGLLWTPPSPNLPVPESLLGFATTGLLQSTTVSFGRGTTTPFTLFGAPWMDGRKLSEKLNALGFPGVFFYHRYFIPCFSLYEGEVCSGVAIAYYDRFACRPVTVAIHILSMLTRDYPNEFGYQTSAAFDRRAGSSQLREWLEAGRPPAEIVEEWQEQAKQFENRRERYLLY